MHRRKLAIPGRRAAAPRTVSFGPDPDGEFRPAADIEPSWCSPLAAVSFHFTSVFHPQRPAIGVGPGAWTPKVLARGLTA